MIPPRLLAPLFLILFAGLSASPEAGLAETGEILLTVERVGAEPIDMDIEKLDALPQDSYFVEHEFVTGRVQFSGPLARSIVTEANGDARSIVVLTALNDYQISIPAKEFFDYDVILTTRMDGELLSPRDKGPIWLMYPVSDFLELQDSSINNKLIWQLVKLEVR